MTSESWRMTFLSEAPFRQTVIRSNGKGEKIRIRLEREMELWFQQDGATCHTARATIDLLKDTLGDRLISRFGPVNWPPRSCDLTLLDYFLWGYVKSLVYADKPQTLDHLEDNIRRVIADIRPQMLEKIIENWTSRLDYIRASRGSHMPEIIFKM
ncbi:transposable element Tc3 transposase [Trichonephila clavipes]|nr:transposable element Tc3 transposase [Trichonephila clavipes]